MRMYFFLAYLLFSSVVVIAQERLPPTPRPMTIFNLRDEEGKMWNQREFADKVVLMEFWATWCATCRKIRPMLNEAATTFRERGLETLFVSIDEDRAALERYLAPKPFVGRVVHDRERRWADWGIQSVPSTFVIANGQIVAQWVGEMERDDLHRAIDRALKSLTED